MAQAAMDTIHISVSGRFAIADPTRDRAVGRGVARELLALLVSARGRPLDTADVIDAIWSDEAPPTAPTIVHGAVSRLRRVLGADVVAREESGYALDPTKVHTDLWEALDLMGEGRQADAVVTVEEPLFGRYADRAWVAPVRRRLGTTTGPEPRSDRGDPAGIATVSRLIGRRRELALVGEALRRSRMVTIVGLGGVGKTRLAAEVAAGWSSRAVQLDLARGTGSFWSRAIGALGAVPPTPPGEERLVLADLVEGVDLLVLDGAEHDLDGTADGAAYLVQRWPRLAVLTTSRAALGVTGEHVVPLLPFESPGDPRGDGAELVLDRLRALGLPLTPADRERAGRVSHRCAGVPLAIELAAADLLSEDTDGPGAARLELIVRGRITEALEALSPSARHLARRASILPAGVAPSVLRHLDEQPVNGETRELLSAAMLTVEADEHGRRYYFPDSIRAELATAGDRADLHIVATALTAVGAPATVPDGASPAVEHLAVALPEVENVVAVLEQLANDPSTPGTELGLALAFRGPLFEGGHWARGERALLGAIQRDDAIGALSAEARAAAVAGLFEVAGSFDAFARLVDLAGPAADAAERAGRDDLVVGLRYAQAAGYGYLGRYAESLTARAVVRETADRSGLEVLQLRADGLDALVLMVTGEAGRARDEFVRVADRCRGNGWLGTAARVRLVAAQSAAAAGDDETALNDARAAEELAVMGMARATLAWTRAQIAELELRRLRRPEPDAVRPVLLAALAASVACGHLRFAGLSRLRLGVLDRDTSVVAHAALVLVQADPQGASLALAHLRDLLPTDHPLAQLAPAAAAQLVRSGGSPLSAPDAELVGALTKGAPRPPTGWEEDLNGLLLSLSAEATSQPKSASS